MTYRKPVQQFKNVHITALPHLLPKRADTNSISMLGVKKKSSPQTLQNVG